MSEKSIEMHLVKRVKEAGGLCLKWTGTSGAPDRVVITRTGETLLVELKQPSGRLSPIQKVMHKNLKDRGVEVFVLWSKSDVDSFAETHLN